MFKARACGLGIPCEGKSRSHVVPGSQACYEVTRPVCGECWAAARRIDLVHLVDHELNRRTIDLVANQPKSQFVSERVTELGLEFTHFKLADFGICRLLIHGPLPLPHPPAVPP